MSAARAERRRQAVHLAMTGFALALRWLTPAQAALCAGAAIVLSWVILPLLGASLRRPGGPFVDGVRTYPVAVLALVLLLPLPQAAAAWAVLGVGDAASNLVGSRVGRPGLFGRSDRSLAGTVAFVAAAAPAALGVHAFVAAAAPDWRTTAVVGLAACAGAAAELLPLPRRVDDNVPIAAASGLVLGLLL